MKKHLHLKRLVNLSLQDNIHNIFVDINKYLINNDESIEDKDASLIH